MIVIVTDSSACLSREEALRLNAVVVPMTYSCGGGPAMAEGYVDENGAFDQAIERGGEQMHTSQASMAAFVAAFQAIAREGNQALCVTMSSRMSGTYSNAVCAAREALGEDGRVVDSLETAAGMLQLILEARARIDAGQGLEETARALEAMRGRVGTVFTVEDIEPLRRSGRIGALKMSVSTILNIRPILTCRDGALASSGVARGHSDQRRQLLQALPDGVKKVYIEGYQAEEQAQALEEALRRRGVDCQRRALGPVLAIHLGSGAVGLSWTRDEA